MGINRRLIVKNEVEKSKQNSQSRNLAKRGSHRRVTIRAKCKDLFSLSEEILNRLYIVKKKTKENNRKLKVYRKSQMSKNLIFQKYLYVAIIQSFSLVSLHLFIRNNFAH